MAGPSSSCASCSRRQRRSKRRSHPDGSSSFRGRGCITGAGAGTGTDETGCSTGWCGRGEIQSGEGCIVQERFQDYELVRKKRTEMTASGGRVRAVLKYYSRLYGMRWSWKLRLRTC